ncbi:iron ABC transporter permease [Corynebacterium sp. TAE3-ERU12]|uniref:FecCD family ABC transporter permease n=1 Tax=Corynebacterium sp. TAE3-ERU12 TaxID=2849491 RepID=UPI001C46881D|nr:iron ABC transporter permease [Corynebacterium sp. TAE3-ERU12]MBV7295747.1 iron ABC transporter permease [Corynebacterium sp. TAE3-ERU12]
MSGVTAHHTARNVVVLSVLSIALVAAAVFSALAGQFNISMGGVFSALMRGIGLAEASDGTETADAVLWFVRFPRICMAALVGAGLAVAGVALQAIFGNPLAEPGLIGVSSGAAVGASAAVVIAPTLSVTAAAGGVQWLTALGAFVGGVVATLVVAAVARGKGGGQSDAATIILVGVAVNAIGGGVVSLLTFIADPSARDQIVFWQLGTFAGASWTAVGIIAVATLIAGAILNMLAAKLDLLSLGELPARHLGVDVDGIRRLIIVVSALLVAAGVAFSGIIAFVGLVVPHALRFIIGPGHKLLIPASMLGGALTTTVADVVARTLIPNADLPLGMITALVGGPMFFWLLDRGRRTVTA